MYGGAVLAAWHSFPSKTPPPEGVVVSTEHASAIRNGCGAPSVHVLCVEHGCFHDVRIIARGPPDRVGSILGYPLPEWITVMYGAKFDQFNITSRTGVRCALEADYMHTG
jgi:hypothetical protein